MKIEGSQRKNAITNSRSLSLINTEYCKYKLHSVEIKKSSVGIIP